MEKVTLRKPLLNFLAIVIAGLAITTVDLARGCDGYGKDGCRRLPTTSHRAAAPYVPFDVYPQQVFSGPFSPTRERPLITGCYGFDHGPFYSPRSCIFPYPCEYYGTCKGRRPSLYQGTPNRRKVWQ